MKKITLSTALVSLLVSIVFVSAEQPHYAVPPAPKPYAVPPKPKQAVPKPIPYTVPPKKASKSHKKQKRHKAKAAVVKKPVAPKRTKIQPANANTPRGLTIHKVQKPAKKYKKFKPHKAKTGIPKQYHGSKPVVHHKPKPASKLHPAVYKTKPPAQPVAKQEKKHKLGKTLHPKTHKSSLKNSQQHTAEKPLLHQKAQSLIIGSKKPLNVKVKQSSIPNREQFDSHGDNRDRDHRDHESDRNHRDHERDRNHRDHERDRDHRDHERDRDHRDHERNRDYNANSGYTKQPTQRPKEKIEIFKGDSKPQHVHRSESAQTTFIPLITVEGKLIDGKGKPVKAQTGLSNFIKIPNSVGTALKVPSAKKGTTTTSAKQTKTQQTNKTIQKQQQKTKATIIHNTKIFNKKTSLQKSQKTKTHQQTVKQQKQTNATANTQKITSTTSKQIKNQKTQQSIKQQNKIKATSNPNKIKSPTGNYKAKTPPVPVPNQMIPKLTPKTYNNPTATGMKPTIKQQTPGIQNMVPGAKVTNSQGKVIGVVQKGANGQKYVAPATKGRIPGATPIVGKPARP